MHIYKNLHFSVLNVDSFHGHLNVNSNKICLRISGINAEFLFFFCLTSTIINIISWLVLHLISKNYIYD